jgi:hypothetical protein
VEKEHERDAWVDALRKATKYRPPMSISAMEMSSDGGEGSLSSESGVSASTANGVINHVNPLHGGASESEYDEDDNQNINSLRTLSSTNFRYALFLPFWLLRFVLECSSL